MFSEQVKKEIEKEILRIEEIANNDDRTFRIYAMDMCTLVRGIAHRMYDAEIDPIQFRLWEAIENTTQALRETYSRQL